MLILNYIFYACVITVIAIDNINECRNIWKDPNQCRKCVNDSLSPKGKYVVSPKVDKWCTRLNFERCFGCMYIFPNKNQSPSISPPAPARKNMEDFDSDISIVSMDEFIRSKRESTSSLHEEVPLSNSKGKLVIPAPERKDHITIPYVKGPKTVKSSPIISDNGRRHHKHIILPNFKEYVSSTNKTLDMSSALVEFLYNNSKLVKVKTTLGTFDNIKSFLDVLVDFDNSEIQNLLSDYARTKLSKEARTVMFAEYVSRRSASDLNSFIAHPGVRDVLLRAILNCSTFEELKSLLVFLTSRREPAIISAGINGMFLEHPGYVASHLAKNDRTVINQQLAKYNLTIASIEDVD